MNEASPGLTANDLEKSLAWYRELLGFVVAPVRAPFRLEGPVLAPEA